jgi:hypothetical protein
MRALAAVLILSALAAPGPAGALPPFGAEAVAHRRARAEGHLRVVLALGPGPAAIRSWRVVSRPLPPPPRGRRATWEVRVEDGDGAALFTARVRAAAAVHGEFPGPSGELERSVAAPPAAALPLRLPLLDRAAWIRILDGGEEVARVRYPRERR